MLWNYKKIYLPNMVNNLKGSLATFFDNKFGFMGIFDIFKSKKANMFEIWLNDILKENLSNI